MLLFVVRGVLLLCAICAALFPSVIKIYETSWQFREAADPSVYDKWRDYFAEKPVVLNNEMTGLSDKTLMRIHLFIIPYFVAAGTFAMAMLLPKPQRKVFSGNLWLMLRTFFRRSIHFPELLQVVLPARITVGEMTGVITFLCMNWGIFVSRVERSLFRGSKKLTFLVDSDKDASKEPIDPNSWKACEVWALTLGILAILIMGWYLFLPIGKRSVFLDMFGISWDSAIKYHRWIGYYTFWLSVVHGIMYLAIFYEKNGDSNFDPKGVLVKHNLNAWGCNAEDECDEDQRLMLRRNMYGISAIVLLIIMVIFSMAYVRRHFFNTFYAMHHLVFVILLFLCLHYKGTIILVLPGLAVYMIDKLLGLLASSNSVDASAEVVSPGVVEVTVPLSSSSSYAAGQYVQVNVPAASALEWHPFSITSAPHEHEGKLLTFHIKALGDWANKVLDAVHAEPLRVRLDGFYGHDLAAPLLDKAGVVLVGGGIGVTPMISVAMKLLHASGPKVHLLWVVRSVEEFNVFGAKLSSAAAAHPDKLSVKVWITLSGAANKDSVTAASVAEQLVFSSKEAGADVVPGSPPVTPNKWTMPPAAQALVTALAILTSTAAFGLSQYVGSEQNEWKPDSQRVFDLFLVVVSLLSVVLVTLVALVGSLRFQQAGTRPPSPASSSMMHPPQYDNSVAQTILLAPTSPDALSTHAVGAVPGMGAGQQVMMTGAAFGHGQAAPVVFNTNPAPMALPRPHPIPVVYGGYPQPMGGYYPQPLGSYPLPVHHMPPDPDPLRFFAPGPTPLYSSSESNARQHALAMLDGRIGRRPDVSAEFDSVAVATTAPLSAEPAVDIGVMAGGPQQLVAKVSAACNDRSQWGTASREVFFSFLEEDWDW